MSIKSLTILSTVLLAGVLMGCSDNEESIYQATDDADEYIPRSLVEIVEGTEVIVKGKFSKRLKTENLIRAADDPTKPADDFYAEGHIYDFEVVETLKGNVSDTIKTAIGFADRIPILSDSGENLGHVMVEMVDYVEINMKNEYLLLLQDSNYIEEGLYTGAWAPHVIEIGEDGSVAFNTKRMEGQLDTSLEMKEEDGNVLVTQITKHRGEVSVDVYQEYGVFGDYLGEANIDDIVDLEQFIVNNI